jgi:hypothetical protein
MLKLPEVEKLQVLKFKRCCAVRNHALGCNVFLIYSFITLI